MVYHARVVLQHLKADGDGTLSTVEEVVMAASEDEAETKVFSQFAKPDVVVASITLKKAIV